MPEAKSFFDDLKDEEEKVGEKIEEKPQEKVEEKQPESKEKDPRDVALERKSTALAEERRKRKELEAKLKEFEGKKDEKEEDLEEDEEEKPVKEKKQSVETKSEPLDEEALLAKLEQRRKVEEYSNKVVEKIGFIAKGANKSKQWALKVKETVDSLPVNLRSGDPETDLRSALRFLESSNEGGSFNMPSSSFDLPVASVSNNTSISDNGRQLAKDKWGMDDKVIDEYLATPRTLLPDGNTSFKLIK